MNNKITGKLIAYFKQKLGVKQWKTGWFRQGTCPSCGKTKKFGVNVSLNRTNCFSCGYNEKPLDIIMRLEGINTLSEVYNFLNAFEGTDYLESPVEFLKEAPGNLPESYKLIIIGKSLMANLARSYLKNRGYRIIKLAMLGVGYCTRGRYEGRIIIPYYRAGELVYINARQFIDLGGAKHKNPELEEYGIGKSMVIYNVDCLYIYNSCYLVESATNALSLGERAFSIGGKMISKYQLSEILRSPCKTIIIILDPDAEWEAIDLALSLVDHKKIKLVLLPKILKSGTNKYMDVNDWGKYDKPKLISWIRKTELISRRELISLRLDVERPLHKLPSA